MSETTRTTTADTRRHFSKATKRAAFTRSGGRCEQILPGGKRCCMPIMIGATYDHVIAWAISGDSSLDNCAAICQRCHDTKTFGHDIPVIAKGVRIRDREQGIAGPGLGQKPLPCGKRSAFSKTFRGEVVPRLTQVEKHRRMMAERNSFGESE